MTPTDHEITTTIGTRAAALRISKRLDKKAVADAAGLSLHMLSRVEKGASALTVPQLVRVAHALSVPCGVLIGEQEFAGFLDQGGQAQ